MEIFSEEGLDLNFPLGEGAIQPRAGQGGKSYGIFPFANVDIHNNFKDKIEKADFFGLIA